MSMNEAKYTLWNIPRSEWSHPPLFDKKISETEKEELIKFARKLKDERLNDEKLKELLRPFETPVTQDTLYQPVGDR